ncbi:MAG TPA: cysteine desulfurase family protein [Planctomycetota bacterium]|nr:cysteine desulfurase family protein [Planctomycetota bacterium]
MDCIYLDHNATTPVDPRVLDVMLPYLRERFGNASSKTHPYGWTAAEAVEGAREKVARLLGATAREVIFTSGATEANNIALLGLFPPSAAGAKRSQIIISAVEHHAVLDTAAELVRRGFEATLLRPDAHGRISAAQVEEAITDRTLLVSLMAANNELGTLNPLAGIGAITRRAGILFHTDAAQAAGKVPLDVESMGIDLLSISGHKFYAPKGIGALYVRARSPRIKLSPLHHGGGQERGLRPGTLNVPGIVGLGEACRIASEDIAVSAAHEGSLRDRLHERIVSRLPGVRRNGHAVESLPGTLSLSFEGIDGTALLVSLPDLAISSGSACTTGSTEPSYVLKAIGVPDDLAHATARFGVGRFTREEEVDRAADRVVEVVGRLRAQLQGVGGPAGRDSGAPGIR